MPTEDVSARFADLDGWPTRDAAVAMFGAQLAAVAAVGPALGVIADTADEAAAALHRGSRLVYAGARRSGRVGGQGALAKSAEGAEDDEAAGASAMDEALVGPDDAVLFSSAAMVRLGRVHGGLMVHMRASNAQLHRRAADRVVRITGCALDAAYAALRQARWEVKSAVLIVHGATSASADALLVRERGILCTALARHGSGGAG